MRIIAMVNQKGGCGKTTSAINTAAAFAELGQRVLLVDFDPQGHASIGVGCDADALDKTIYDVLTRPGTRLADVVTRTSVGGLDLAPCNVLLAGAELELIGRAGRELLLARALQTVRDSYDLCVIDCPPSLGTLTLNALVTSTDVIVPVQMHYYALEGLRRLLETVRIIHQRYPSVLRGEHRRAADLHRRANHLQPADSAADAGGLWRAGLQHRHSPEHPVGRGARARASRF